MVTRILIAAIAFMLTAVASEAEQTNCGEILAYGIADTVDKGSTIYGRELVTRDICQSRSKAVQTNAGFTIKGVPFTGEGNYSDLNNSCENYARDRVLDEKQWEIVKKVNDTVVNAWLACTTQNEPGLSVSLEQKADFETIRGRIKYKTETGRRPPLKLMVTLPIDSIKPGSCRCELSIGAECKVLEKGGAYAIEATLDDGAKQTFTCQRASSHGVDVELSSSEGNRSAGLPALQLGSQLRAGTTFFNAGNCDVKKRVKSDMAVAIEGYEIRPDTPVQIFVKGSGGGNCPGCRKYLAKEFPVLLDKLVLSARRKFNEHGLWAKMPGGDEFQLIHQGGNASCPSHAYGAFERLTIQLTCMNRLPENAGGCSIQ